MKILLSGSHGLIGSELKRRLESEGHAIEPLSRDFSQPIDFSGVDAVIHLAGENIAEGRWTKEKKQRIKESRVEGTKLLAEQIANNPSKPSVFISASAIGYYGDRSDESLDESSAPGTGFLSEVCIKWENASKAAEAAGIRTVQIRTGIVLAKEGGALKKMLPPFKMGGGGILGDGRQYMSWISLEDEINAISFILREKSISGPVNLVSPQPLQNKSFTKILGQVLHRPTFMPLPAFAARLVFGEMADALLLSSTRVEPRKLVRSGFAFKHQELKHALEDILK